MPACAFPLQDVRVVDASGYLTGPFTAMVLGDLGADVIKVEQPPKGDPLRRIGHRFRGESVQCDSVNRNKRSVFLDLRDGADRDTFLRLVATADVMIQNWRPGVAESFDLSDELLASTQPKLIRVSITGYGPTGPSAQRPAFDAIIQAETGLARRQSNDGRPEPVRTYLADKVTSFVAVQAILGALLARERTGVGDRIDVAMLDAVAYFNFPDLMERQTFLADPAGADDTAPRSFVVATSDGYIVVAPATGAQVKRALDAIERPDLMDALRELKDAGALMKGMLDALETVTVTKPTEHWLRRFSACDVPVARVSSFADHVADPQVVHNETYLRHEHPRLGLQRYPRFPAWFGGAPLPPLRRSAPAAGEHTADVLASVQRSV